ncbi:hypothetical protein [Candidatus Hodarchaeum mangrovi]
MNNLSNNETLLLEAKNEIYTWATNDLTCLLAKEVMSIGLAKIKYFYRSLGEDPFNVITIFGPDGGITRNKERFNEGVGYGCLVATKDYIFPSLLHPNGCGYGFYKIHNLPSLKDIMIKIDKIKKNGIPIGSEKGKWDVWKSNHFIDFLFLDDLYSNDQAIRSWLTPGNYVLIHSSQQTQKDRLSMWSQNDFISFESPFGSVKGLPKEKIAEYFNFFQKMETFSKNKRTSIAKELFGEENIEIISNPTHQGYFKENGFQVMRLGLSNSLHQSGDKNLRLFPLGFNGYSFIYLYEGLRNIKKNHWTVKQLERAQSYGHEEFIQNANILPHGGGYKLLYPYSDVEKIIFNNKIFFRLSNAPMKSCLIIQDIEALEYGYRGSNEILPMIERLELGKRIARFTPEIVIKL